MGDKIGLLVDMDKRTMEIHRNGVPVPGLVFANLPDEVYVVACPLYKACTVRLVGAGWAREGE